MDDIVKVLAIGWLTAEDAFSASCVSPQWRAALSDTQENSRLMWKQVCHNSYPLLDANRMFQDEINYRRLALGLWGGKLPRVTTPTVSTMAPPEDNVTLLTPEDLFAVIDLYRLQTSDSGRKRRKQVLASWVCPVSSCGGSFIHIDFNAHEDKNFVLKGPNPYSEEHNEDEEVLEWMEGWADSSPVLYAGLRALGLGLGWHSFYDKDRDLNAVVRATVTVFQKDNMKSVRILDDTFGEYSHFVDSSYFRDDEEGPEFDSDSFAKGSEACTLLRNAGYARVKANGKLLLTPRLPLAGSDPEPKWLKNCRQSLGENQPYEPGEADRDALAKVSHFVFEPTRFYLDLQRCKEGEYCGYAFERNNDIMVTLTGLCWA